MSEPVAFISHFRVKPGASGDAVQLSRDVAEKLRAEKPRTLAYIFFMDQDRTRMTIVHVFPDREAMDVHAEGAAERSRVAYELMVPDGWEVYGQPSDSAMEMLRQAAETAGVSLTVQRAFVGGFLRGGAEPG